MFRGQALLGSRRGRNYEMEVFEWQVAGAGFQLARSLVLLAQFGNGDHQDVAEILCGYIGPMHVNPSRIPTCWSRATSIVHCCHCMYVLCKVVLACSVLCQFEAPSNKLVGPAEVRMTRCAPPGVSAVTKLLPSQGWPICPAARCSVQKPTTQANTTSNHRRMLEPRRPARTPDTTKLGCRMLHHNHHARYTMQQLVRVSPILLLPCAPGLRC
jgi:hypothetical protein